MNIVIIGHVDHGKSTLVGRLLADTGSLPEGKLDAVRALCQRNAKPFEYAFLLDALKDEQAQGITIDSARCFFKSARRDYIIIDAPGHIEFLKNMISGAARAEGALLLIDAKEGIRENSRRHGYLMSLLGIRQIAVCVNKMDLVSYDHGVYDEIAGQYSQFLAQAGVEPIAFIPIAAREGVNIIGRSSEIPWYHGPSILEMVDLFEKEALPVEKPLRMPVQDIYKFTSAGDDRRIVAGRIETGSVRVGDEVLFLPSGKRSTVASIEAFNAPQQEIAQAGQSTGLTLATQIYIKPGELMVRANPSDGVARLLSLQPCADTPLLQTTQQCHPHVSTRLQATIFWLGQAPMIQGKRYKMKLAGTRAPVWLTGISSVIDASTLEGSTARQQVERHEVAQVTLETLKPVACDLAADLPQTGRFVLIDNYEIAGGGTIMTASPATNTLAAKQVADREKAWDRSRLTPAARASRYNQRATLVLLTGGAEAGCAALAKGLEERLFASGKMAYYLGLSNSLLGDVGLADSGQRDEYLRRVGEVSHLFTDAGVILVTAVSDLDEYELDVVRTLTSPSDLLLVTVGEQELTGRGQDLHLDAQTSKDPQSAIGKIVSLLQSRNYLPEYYL